MQPKSDSVCMQSETLGLLRLEGSKEDSVMEEDSVMDRASKEGLEEDCTKSKMGVLVS